MSVHQSTSEAPDGRIRVSAGQRACIAFLKRQVHPRERYLFLAGAGISRDSGIPLASEVTREILRVTSRPIRDPLLRRHLLRPPTKDALRFEALMEMLRRSVDPNLDILAQFGSAEIKPNPNHAALGALAVRGHVVMTTNFDDLIERAAPRPVSNVIDDAGFHAAVQKRHLPSAIFKLHGSLQRHVPGSKRTGSMDTIQASLDQIGSGGRNFNKSHGKSAFLHRVLRDHPLIVLGYSGKDDFDISEILCRAESHQPLIWIDHSMDPARMGLWRSGGRTGPHIDLLRTMLGKDCAHSRPIAILRMPAGDALGCILTGLTGLSMDPIGPAARFSLESWFDTHLSAAWRQWLLAAFIYNQFDRFGSFGAASTSAWRSRSVTTSTNVLCGAQCAWGAYYASRYAGAAAWCERLRPQAMEVLHSRSVSMEITRAAGEILMLRSEVENQRLDHHRGRIYARQTLDALERALPTKSDRQSARGREYLWAMQASTYTTLGAMSMQAGNLKRAEVELREGLKTSLRSGDLHQEANCRAGLADVNRMRGRLKSSERMYDDAERLHKFIGEDWDRGWILLARSEICRRKGRGDHDRAQEFLREACSVYRNDPDPVIRANVARAKAVQQLIASDGHSAAALPSATKAAEAYASAKFWAGVAAAELTIAEFHRKHGQRRLAARALRKALDISTRYRVGFEHAGACLGFYLLTGEQKYLRKASRFYAAEECRWGVTEAERLRGYDVSRWREYPPMDFIFL